MSRAAHLRLVPGLVLLPIVVLVTGCLEPAPESLPVAGAGPGGLSAAGPPAPEERTRPEVFTWSEQPTVDDIPARPVEGVIAGIEMTSPQVKVASEGDRYRLKFISSAWAFPEEREEESREGIARAADQVATAMLYFTLAQGETGPLEWEFGNAARDAEGSYAYAPNPDQYVLYANRDWAGALEITSWENGLPIAGRVALCFDDLWQSWVAGEFEAQPGEP